MNTEQIDIIVRMARDQSIPDALLVKLEEVSGKLLFLDCCGRFGSI